MRFLVLQHVDVEHPGTFRDFFREDGVRWDVVHLDRGDAIPDLAPYDCMLVMGGPQDVWEEDAYPWLVPEKAAIRQFVADLSRPFLGICLGHQLLADALGGYVRPGTTEVGVMTVERTAQGRSDPLLDGLPDPTTVLQWHGAAVSRLPKGATLLASSPDCRVQAFRVGPLAYGLQYHVGDRRRHGGRVGCDPRLCRVPAARHGRGRARAPAPRCGRPGGGFSRGCPQVVRQPAGPRDGLRQSRLILSVTPAMRGALTNVCQLPPWNTESNTRKLLVLSVRLRPQMTAS